MDKGTQKEVTAKHPWSYDGSFACKECKHIHEFRQYDGDEDIAAQFTFPNAPDLSIVIIPCLDNEKAHHEYKYEELIMSPSTRAEARLDEVEQRLSSLEAMLGKGASAQDEKPVRDRLTGLEDTLGKVAGAVLGGKPKEPPAGQHQ